MSKKVVAGGCLYRPGVAVFLEIRVLAETSGGVLLCHRLRLDEWPFSEKTVLNGWVRRLLANPNITELKCSPQPSKYSNRSKPADAVDVGSISE